MPTIHVAPESEDTNTPPCALLRTMCVQVLSQAAPRQSLKLPVLAAPSDTAVKVPPRGPMRGIPEPVATFFVFRSAIIIFVPSPLIAPGQPPP